MNKPGIVCHPIGDGANRQTAEILNGLIRNIEYTSNAEVAYDTALDSAVTGGFGYFRIATQYAHDDSFEQDLCIERINNPLSVYGDHRSTAADSADWNVAFITEMYDDSTFEAKFGKQAEKADFEADSRDKGRDWFTQDSTRVAEYWTRDEVADELLKLSDGMVLRKAEFEKIADIARAMGVTVVGTRPTRSMRVTQRIITGAEVLEKNPWAGKYIPIVPVYGDEVVVEGERHWISLIRFSKDAQKMLNYWRTASTELVALAPKAPWLGPRGAFNSNADKWNTANTVNHAYLEYDGPVAPQRQAFAGPPAGALQEAANAQDDMKSVMGMFDASLGARSNETSGRAIMARQREGDTSTFNFVDNLSRAIRHAGRILVDMIPHVYNTERIIRIIHEDGDNDAIPVNQPVQPGQLPQRLTPQQQDNQKDQAEHAEGMMRIFDLTTGKYDVTCSAGPSFNTKREAAAEQQMQFLQAVPNAGPLIGDIIAKNMDWPGSDDIADRLKAMLPPQLQGANPQLQAMQAQMQQMDGQAREAVGQLNGQLQQLQQQLQQAATKDQAAALDKQIDAKKLEIDAFKAQTDRMKAEADVADKQAHVKLEMAQAQESAQQLQAQAQQTWAVMQALQESIAQLAAPRVVVRGEDGLIAQL